jgi:hypothetical protein
VDDHWFDAFPLKSELSPGCTFRAHVATGTHGRQCATRRFVTRVLPLQKTREVSYMTVTLSDGTLVSIDPDARHENVTIKSGKNEVVVGFDEIPG